MSEAVRELEALEPSIKSAAGSVVVGGGPYLEAVHGAGSETRKQPHNSWAGQLLLRGEMRARQAEVVLGVIQMHWQPPMPTLHTQILSSIWVCSVGGWGLVVGSNMQESLET